MINFEIYYYRYKMIIFSPRAQMPKSSNFLSKAILCILVVIQSFGLFERVKCEILNEGAIEDIIEEQEERGIYRLETKNEMKKFPSVQYEELKIFCHHGKF